MLTNYIPRKDWNARSPVQVSHLPWSEIDTIYVHYTSMLSDETGDPREKMRGVQNYHMDTKHWNDFAYNFAFSRMGQILEGRGWQVKSAATGPENSHSVAFVFLGGDKVDRDDVTAKGRVALGNLIREAMSLKHGKLFVKGHTQAPGSVGNTACPGPELLNFIALQGWEIQEPAIRYPKRFFRFAAWYLGEGDFKKYGPHKLSVRPKALPYRGSPQMIPYMIALRHFVAQRKK